MERCLFGVNNLRMTLLHGSIPQWKLIWPELIFNWCDLSPAQVKPVSELGNPML